MISDIIGKLFPPKLGRIEGIDAVIRRHEISNGTLKVYNGVLTMRDGTELPDDSRPGRVFEWPDGRHRRPRRLR